MVTILFQKCSYLIRFFLANKEVWLNDEQHGNAEDKSKHLINFDCGLLKVGNTLRVRLVHNKGEKEYANEYLVFQKLELQSSYERLQHAMAHYYKKISNASRSLEKNSTDNTVASSTSSAGSNSNSRHSVSLSDSMESTDSSDLFTPEFKVGNWCAAKLSVSKTWCRCIIREISNKKAFVESVDDDQRQYMPLCKLEKLSDNFKLMHRFAFKAKLNDSLVSVNMLTSNSIDSLKAFIVNRQKSNGNELVARVVEVLKVSHGEHAGLNENVYEINLSMADNKRIFDRQ